MKKIDRLSVKYHDRNVGTMSLTPDNRLCVFEYDREWLADGFSISPLELPLKPGMFIAKPTCLEMSQNGPSVAPTRCSLWLEEAMRLRKTNAMTNFASSTTVM